MSSLHIVNRKKIIARLDAISDDMWMIAMAPTLTSNERAAVLGYTDSIAYLVDQLTSGSYDMPRLHRPEADA